MIDAHQRKQKQRLTMRRHSFQRDVSLKRMELRTLENQVLSLKSN